MSNLQQTVQNNYLVAAQSSIVNHGRYWFFDARPSAGVLANLLRASGYDVILHEMKPDWEYVVSLTSNSVSDTVDIAQERALQRANGVPEANLPK